MHRRKILLALLGLMLLIPVAPAQARVRLRGWHFPKPFTMNSPMTPHRFGGMEMGFNFADAGTGLAFPLRSSMTPRKSNFAVELTLPMGIGVPDSGDSKFYMGNPTLGLTGNWRFMFPFADGHRFPAAWSVGADVGVPLAGIWGGNAATLLCFPLYVREYAAWLPNFVIRPKATLAVGKPIFFTEFELGIPGLGVTMAGGTYTVVDWGVTLGSQPHELVSITLEFGGVHAMHSDVGGNPLSGNPVWGALGARFYIGDHFVTGLMMRVPFNKAFKDWGNTEAGSGPNWESTFGFSLFVGYQTKEHPGF